MTFYLYGYDAANVAANDAGTVLPGTTATVTSDAAGLVPFTATKAVQPANLNPGSDTGGLVTADSLGRLGFFTTDYTGQLYLRQGGNAWPVNPTNHKAAIDAATVTKVNKGAVQHNAADYGANPAGSEAANSAAIVAAVTAAAGMPVYLPAGRYLASPEFTDQSIHLTGPGVLLQPQGKSALAVARTFGAALPVTQSTVQLGPNLPPSGVWTQTLTRLDVPSGEVAQFKGGDVYHLCSQDAYPWAAEAIPTVTPLTNVWQAGFVSILGVAVDVSSPTNGGPAEGAIVTGSTSGAQGNIQGSTPTDNTATPAGHRVLFSQVSDDFAAGETLTAGGVAVGTVSGAPYLVLTELLDDTYTTTPVIRKVPKTPCHLEVTVEADGDPDELLDDPAARVPAVSLTGVYKPTVRAAVLSAWTRAVLLKSCYMPDVDASVDSLPNHAQPSESAYGYGVEIRGCTQSGRYRINARNLRHGFTTNPGASTWTLGAYLQYGTVKHNTVHDSTVEGALGASYDTHEGAYFTTFENCRSIRPASGGRVITVPAGFQNRGFGSQYRDCTAEGGWVGFIEAGCGDTAGFVHVTRYIDCLATGWAYGGFVQGAASVGGYARLVFDGCTARGDGSATNQPYYQAPFYLFTAAVASLTNCRASRFNAAAIQIKGAASVDIDGFHADYSDNPGDSTLGIRLDGTTTELNISNHRIRTNGASHPLQVVRNVTGNTPVVIDGLHILNTAAPPTLLTTDAGAPTLTVRRDPALATVQPTPHSTAVAPTVAPGAGAGTAPPTPELVAGSTDLAGAVRLGTGTATAAGVVISVTFGTPFPAAPQVIVAPASNATTGRNVYVTNITATGFDIAMNQTPAVSQVVGGYRAAWMTV